MRVLPVFLAVCAGMSGLGAADFTHAYVVGLKGLIGKYDSAFNQLDSKKIGSFSKGRAVTSADISRDSRTLFLSARQEGSPLLVVSAEDLREFDVGNIRFPPLPGKFERYSPMSVEAAPDNFVYIDDVMIGAVRVDLESGSVEPVRTKPRRNGVTDSAGRHIVTFSKDQEVSYDKAAKAVSIPAQIGNRLLWIDITPDEKRLVVFYAAGGRLKRLELERSSGRTVSSTSAPLVDGRKRDVSDSVGSARIISANGAPLLCVLDSSGDMLFYNKGNCSLAFEIKAPEFPGDIHSFASNAWLSPDAKFLVHSVPYRLSDGPDSERDHARLTFFDLKKRRAVKSEDFPGDVVKVLWANEG